MPVSQPTYRAGMSKVLMEKLVRGVAMWLLHGLGAEFAFPGQPECSEKGMGSGESMLWCATCSFTVIYAYRKVIVCVLPIYTQRGLYQELGDAWCGKAFSEHGIFCLLQVQGKRCWVGWELVLFWVIGADFALPTHLRAVVLEIGVSSTTVLVWWSYFLCSYVCDKQSSREWKTTEIKASEEMMQLVFQNYLEPLVEKVVAVWFGLNPGLPAARILKGAQVHHALVWAAFQLLTHFCSFGHSSITQKEAFWEVQSSVCCSKPCAARCAYRHVTFPSFPLCRRGKTVPSKRSQHNIPRVPLYFRLLN